MEKIEANLKDPGKDIFNDRLLRLHYYIAGAVVFFISLAAYLFTVAPTVSFWDCGEFIAASTTLAIPHPPGTPLFVIFGRTVDILLPFIEEPAYRINLISVFGSSITVFFCFWIIVKTVCSVIPGYKTKASRYIPMAGGFAGALLAGFGDTFWFNAVEAEVYGIAMAFIAAQVWLTFKWKEKYDTDAIGSDRYLLFITYLAFLGVGLHLYTMLVIPAIYLFVVIVSPEKREDWRFWVVFLFLLTVITNVGDFLRAASITSLLFGNGSVHGIITYVPLGFIFMYGSMILFGEKVSVFHKKTVGLALGGFAALIWFVMLIKTQPLLQPSIAESGGDSWYAFGKAVSGLLAAGLLGSAVYRVVNILFGSSEDESPRMEYEHGLWNKLLLSTIVFMVLALVNSRIPWEKFTGESSIFIPGYIFVLIAVCAYGWFSEKNKGNATAAMRWRFCFWLSLVAFIGYSSHFYIMIRSFLDPFIDENNPETWEKFKYFLERKQYGSESMLTRMFYRRGLFASQFLSHPHMGFGGYMIRQFFNIGTVATPEGGLGGNVIFNAGTWKNFLKLVIYLIPVIFSFWTMNRSLKIRKKNPAIIFMIFIYAISSFFIIVYLNFADGNMPERGDYARLQMQYERYAEHARSSGEMNVMPERQWIWQYLDPVHMEVRERDYFFTPGFMFYAVWIGVGLSLLLYLISLKVPGLPYMSYLLYFVMGLTVLSPSVAYFTNVHKHSRAGNYVAYDYAYNLLQSCDKDAVLFTNGDNDTFPLWFLQETEGIRKDVRVVNLSLLNTDWYIEQLIDYEPSLDLSFESGGKDYFAVYDEQFRPRAVNTKEDFLRIMNHRPNRLEKPKAMKIAGCEVIIPARDKRSMFQIQHYMIANIVEFNDWKRPVYFAVTVSEDARMGLFNGYLRFEGLTSRLYPEKVQNTDRNDMARLRHNLDKVYRYTNLGKKDVFINQETRRLLNNYGAAFMTYSDACQSEAEDIRKKIEFLGDDAKAAGVKVDSLEKAVDSLDAEVEEKTSRLLSLLPLNWRMSLMTAEMYRKAGKTKRASEILERQLKLTPGDYDALRYAADMFSRMNEKEKAADFFRKLIYETDPGLDSARTKSVVVNLLRIYSETGKEKEFEELINFWKLREPSSEEPERIKQYLRSSFPAGKSGGERTE